jgi:hypothetical protein
VVKQATGNLWTFPADARCITTNGATRHDGQAVMGRGVAAQAKERWPRLPAILGESIQRRGNHVTDLLVGPHDLIIAFPVKMHWRERANLALIGRSCGELMALLNQTGFESVLLPRPGCGNGRLDWAEVGPAIAPLLDDRVTIVYSDVVEA